MWFVTIRMLWRQGRNKCRCTYRPFDERRETRRTWIKDMSCMYHWMKTYYYIRKKKYIRVPSEE